MLPPFPFFFFFLALRMPLFDNALTMPLLDNASPLSYLFLALRMPLFDLHHRPFPSPPSKEKEERETQPINKSVRLTSALRYKLIYI